MSNKYESVADLADKVQWEGGLTAAILDYGIRVADLPDGAPADVQSAWKRVEDVADDVNFIQRWLDDNGGAEDV
jgi:hypothetical protein